MLGLDKLAASWKGASPAARQAALAGLAQAFGSGAQGGRMVPIGSGYMMYQRPNMGQAVGAGAAAGLASLAQSEGRAGERADSLAALREELGIRTEAEGQAMDLLEPKRLAAAVARAEAMGDLELAQALRQMQALGPERIKQAVAEREALGPVETGVLEERERRLGGVRTENEARRLGLLGPLQEQLRQTSARNQAGERLDERVMNRPYDRQYALEDLEGGNLARLSLAAGLDKLAQEREGRDFEQWKQRQGMLQEEPAFPWMKGLPDGMAQQFLGGMMGERIDPSSPEALRSFIDTMVSRPADDWGWTGEDETGIGFNSTLGKQLLKRNLDPRREDHFQRYMQERAKPSWWQFWK